MNALNSRLHDQAERTADQRIAGPANYSREFERLAQHAPDMITRHGRDYRYLFASAHIQTFTGIPPEAYIGKSYREMGFPEELCHYFDEQLRITFEKKKRHHCRYRARAEEEVHIESRLIPEFDEAGEVESVLVISTDITERQKAEDALAYQKKLLETVTDNTSLSLLLLDTERRCMYMNEAAERTTGYRFDDVKGLDMHRLFHHSYPDGRPYPVEDCPLAKAGQRQESASGEEYFVHRDGHFYPVTYTASPIILDGQAFGTVVELRDISEEKRREEELRRTEHRFQHLANSLPLVVWATTPEGKLNFVNEQWAIRYGNALEEAQGDGWARFIHPDDLARTNAVWQQSLRTGEAYENEFRIRTATGEYRWMLVRATPVRDETGAIISWHGSNTDIQDKKEFEDLLEEKVRQRTRELEERRAELEQFIYVSHHDLQEPLRKIIMFSDLIASDPGSSLSPRSGTRLERIISASRRMSAALRDVLDFASLSKEETIEEVELGEVLQTVLTDLELAISEKSAVIEAGVLPRVRAIPHQMHQLLYNLLSNALKFSNGETAPRIRIQSETSAEGKHAVRVEDNGIGFEPAFAETIFALFKRLHTKDRFPGTGIGLALCRKIVERHGGSITATGAPGRGACFTFTLPRDPHQP